MFRGGFRGSLSIETYNKDLILHKGPWCLDVKGLFSRD